MSIYVLDLYILTEWQAQLTHTTYFPSDTVIENEYQAFLQEAAVTGEQAELKSLIREVDKANYYNFSLNFFAGH